MSRRRPADRRCRPGRDPDPPAARPGDRRPLRIRRSVEPPNRRTEPDRVHPRVRVVPEARGRPHRHRGDGRAPARVPGELGMKVQVLLFARYAEAAGAPVVAVEVEEGTTLAEVWASIRAHCPGLEGVARPLMAADRAYATPDTKIVPGMEVAFFPPVSGG